VKRKYPKSLVWPERVFVLTTQDLSGLPGCDINNNPQSTFLWMNAEIRDLPMTTSDTFLFCDIWTDVLVKIMTKLKRKKLAYKKCDLYNATWAYLGYTENQCPLALKFASLLD
jgi:hypothetical protein